MSVFTVVLDASLRATPLLAAVVLACAVRPRSAPALRHLALAAALLGFVAIPVFALVLPAWTVVVPDAAWAAAGVPAGPAASVPTSAPRTPHAWTAAAAVWTAGAAFLLARVAVGAVGVARLRRTARARGRLLARRGRVPVIVTDAVAVPATAGWLRPVVLLPAPAAAWPAAERDAVVAHELAHVRRGDAWTLLAAAVVQALHWPNPLVWIAARQMRAASEEACDAAVVAAGTHPADYARLLVRLARGAAPLPPLLPGMASATGLSRRVEVLLRGRARTVGAGKGALAAAALALLLAAAAAARPIPALEAAAARYAGRFGIGAELAGRILRTAAAERVDPDLAFALVSVESGFDPARTSRRGAVGLTQLLPSTAAGLQPDITPERLRDSDTNLRLGFRLLNQNLERFPGDPRRALLAYSVGPRRAARSDALDASPYPCQVLRLAGAAARHGC